MPCLADFAMETKVHAFEVDAIPAALLNNGLGLISIIEFLWLHYIPSLADRTMETNVYTSELDAIGAGLAQAV
jgi:hypothetical protein